MSKAEPAKPGAAGQVFSPVVAGWLLAAGVFGFCAFLVLQAFAPDLRNGYDGGAHALSRSAVGFAGLVRLLKAEGETVLVSRRPPSAREAPPALTVITPDIDTDGGDLAKRAAHGRVLIVLPKWLTVPDFQRPGWVTPFRLVDPDAVRRMLKPTLGEVSIDRRNDNAPLTLDEADWRPAVADAASVGPRQPPFDGREVAGRTGELVVHLQILKAAAGLRPVLSDAAGDVVLASTPDNRVFVLSDPDLLNTRGLRELAGARLAVALIDGLRSPGETAVFDVTLNGFNTPPNLFKLAFEPPFLGATLCLFAAAVLMGVHAVSRFGAPLAEARVFALGKEALADNSAALIRLAGREPRMAVRYLDLTRAAVIRELGAARVPPDQVDAFLDRLGERLGARRRLSDLARAATGAKGRDDALAAARDLHEWRLEMTREPQ